MSCRHFLRIDDLTADELKQLLDDAASLKRDRAMGTLHNHLEGKTLLVVLEKASTRTRLSFEVAARELGGFVSTVLAKDSQMGRNEPIEDTARVMSRYAHGIVYRTSDHRKLERLSEYSTVPVINGLSDWNHPCQLLADLLTVQEHRGSLEGLRVAWVGDGNNVAHSWMLSARLLGFEVMVACPEGYEPDPDVVKASGDVVTVTRDPAEACRGAHVITTDVWSSMGQEAEQSARRAAFAAYSVTDGLMELGHSDAIFLHCLPAHRGEEVSASVMEGPSSRVWDEAENRLHAQKALLRFLVPNQRP